MKPALLMTLAMLLGTAPQALAGHGGGHATKSVPPKVHSASKPKAPTTTKTALSKIMSSKTH